MLKTLMLGGGGGKFLYAAQASLHELVNVNCQH
jgi:hypothetical protein